MQQCYSKRRCAALTSQHAVACALLDEVARGGETDVALISAMRTPAFRSPYRSAHIPGQLTHVSAATMGYVWTIFCTLIVFLASFFFVGPPKITQTQKSKPWDLTLTRGLRIGTCMHALVCIGQDSLSTSCHGGFILTAIYGVCKHAT